MWADLFSFVIRSRVLAIVDSESQCDKIFYFYVTIDSEISLSFTSIIEHKIHVYFQLFKNFDLILNILGFDLLPYWVINTFSWLDLTSNGFIWK